MFIIGLTGGIGSGKSLVSDLFSQLGIEIIDTDVIARELVKLGGPALEQIKHHFGASIINSKQELNRAALRQKIFADPVEKKWLENLLHPLIHVEANRRTKSAKSPYCIIVIPLLFESQRDYLLDRVLVIEASKETQIQRVMQRDKTKQVEVEKIIDAQANLETRRAGADDIIQNNSSVAEVEEQVKKLHVLYLKLAQQKS